MSVSRHLARAGFGMIAALVLASPAVAQVDKLRVQKVGGDTFFHVKINAPKDFKLPTFGTDQPGSTPAVRWDLSRLPRLLPLDDKTAAVCFAGGLPRLFQKDFAFAGKLRGDGEAKFLLVYPIEVRKPVAEKEARFERLYRERDWAEVPLTLDFARAESVPPPKNPPRRPDIVPNDALDRIWAASQAQQFAVLEASTKNFGFYGFARETTNRKYNVAVKPMEAHPPFEGNLIGQLYENTTGATAITEALQLERMLRPDRRDRGPRTIDVADVKGIAAEVKDWDKLLAGKKPNVEPLAKLVPADNWYAHFKDLRKLMEAGELMQQYGNTGLQAFDLTVRDERLQQKYEKQLCLRSGLEAKLLGNALVKSVAVTGSDFQFREGTDVTAILHAANVRLLLASSEPWLEAARKEFGDKLKAGKDEYLGVAIESYVSPLREVSLHRAVVDDYVICSNSAVAIRRVLDVAKGKAKSLAESPDFQSMRTVFTPDDKDEDGFVFLSDAFIRRQVTPAAKIKEKRRLEALTSLHLATSAALFTAWETGKPPADQKSIMDISGLKAEELDVPEGKPVTWDADRNVAVSEVYNTLHFVTPLLELPIDKVTAAEERDYARFRQDYFSFWRRYYDPIGMRLALGEKRVRWDVFLIPMNEEHAYAELRALTGSTTTKLDPGQRTPNTLIQGVASVGAELPQRRDKVVGDQAMFRLEGGPAMRRFAEAWVNDACGATSLDLWFLAVASLADGSLPVLGGFRLNETKEPEKIAAYFLPTAMTEQAPEAYREQPLFTTRFRELLLLIKLHHAKVDDAWYVSFSDALIKSQIDLTKDRKDQPKPEDLVEVNASVYLAPGALAKAKDSVGLFLEWEGHRRALDNNAIWYVLYRGGVLPADATDQQMRAAAERWFGFVPVSPDKAPYRYDRQHDEVLNQRHGSPGRPKMSRNLDEESPLAKLLGGIDSMRADLRLQDDGVRTTVVIDRHPAR